MHKCHLNPTTHTRGESSVLDNKRRLWLTSSAEEKIARRRDFFFKMPQPHANAEACLSATTNNQGPFNANTKQQNCQTIFFENNTYYHFLLRNISFFIMKKTRPRGGVAHTPPLGPLGHPDFCDPTEPFSKLFPKESQNISGFVRQVRDQPVHLPLPKIFF